MKYSVEIIKEIVGRNPGSEIIYFWGHTPNPKKITAACLSQWYDCYFEVDGVMYHTTEQYMMASKARLFNDEETLRKIMEAYNPHDYKKLGRKVSGFDGERWDAVKYDIVVEGNIAKFSQNAALKEFLLSTGDAILVEASPYDEVWGIGLDRETAMKATVNEWRGENLLGCALMDVRDRLRESDADIASPDSGNAAEVNTEGLMALKLWTLGAGNSAKRFNGEEPMPEKRAVATENSWHTMPMPEKCAVIPMNETIPSAAMRIVKYGHIPEAMEDHWFMYCDDTTIRYYRSWTGICAFIAKYEDDGTVCRITELTVNRDPEQYRCTDNNHDVALFMALLTDEYGGDSGRYWSRVLMG
ncbi:MAG: NADAR family protein [Bacteroidales bacterium]|nr:NADAR family protein [Bacteroidales bacterium]